MICYQFNADLFCELHKITGVPLTTICSICGIGTDNYRRWQSTRKVPIMSIIKLCNGMKIPSVAFINNGIAELVPTRDNLLMWGRFDNLSFDITRLQTDLTDGIGLSYNSIARFTNRSTATIIKWLTPEDGNTIMTINDFLYICNQFKLWPLNYIHDTNRSLALLPGYRKNVRQVDLSQITSRLSSEKKVLFDKILAAVEAKQAYNIPVNDDEIKFLAAEYHV